MKKYDLNNILKKYFDANYNFFIEFIETLNDIGIKPVLINLPIYFANNKPANDLDIVINEKQYETMTFHFKGKYLEVNEIYNRYGKKQHLLVFYDKNRNKQVRIHIHIGLNFFDLDILTYNTIVNNSIENPYFSYPNPYLTYIISNIEFFFRKKENYIERINSIEKILQSKKQIKINESKILNKIIKEKNKKRFLHNFYRLFFLLRYIKQKNKLLKFMFLRLLKKILSVFSSRNGKLIFFLGVDGSGKTTLAKKFSDEMNQRGIFTRYKYWGLKITLVQRLRRLLLKKNQRDTYNMKTGIAQKLDSKSKLSATLFRSLLICFYIFEYMIRTFLELIYIKKANNMIIIDRTYYDKLLEKNNLLRWLYYYLLPKPDIIFFAKGENSVLYNRKKEISFEKIGEMQDQLTGVVKKLKEKNIKVYDIDTTKLDIEKSIAFINKKVWLDHV